jgi:hypothetical protein
VTTAATQDTANLNPAPQITVMYSASAAGPYTDSTQGNDGYVQVTATWTFNTIATYPGIPSTVTLSRSVRIQIAPNLPTFGAGG